jgi:nitrite reductase/ring-hydroxylating ferredoxin subunit
MIEVVAEEKSSTSGVIPPDSLMTRVHADGHRAAAWQPVPDLAELAPGEVGGFSVAGSVVLACRVGEDFFAYRDRCAACGASMAGTQLRGEVLRCPQCNTGYDAIHAGVGVGSAVHLEPLPVLIRDGLLSMALPAEEVAL